eukprot:scaffold247_cov172-Ochromonas_danica.AAC.33
MSGYPPPSGPYGPPPSNLYSIPPGSSSSGAPGVYPGQRPGAPPMYQTAAGGPPAVGAPAAYAPPGTVPPSYGAPAPQYGAPPAQYGAPAPQYGAPNAAPAAGPPAGPYGAAPPSYGGVPAAPNSPAMYGPPGAPNAPGAPAGPPTAYGGPPSGSATPGRPNVQFFSPSGGAAVQAPPNAPAPGPSMGPPTIGPPPMVAAPLSMPPPPSGVAFGAPPVGPGGAVAPPPPPAPMYSVNYGTNSGPFMPHGFESGGNLAGGATTPTAAGAAAEVAGGVAAGGAVPLPTLEEMDLSIQCNPAFLRATVSKLVASQAQATASRIPLGVVCKPMAGDRGTTNDDIEVVDFGSTGIVRCKRCRTYINPYVSWADNGRRWRCNICGMLNDVPSTYFSHLDNQGRRRDRDQRPELRNASVEFVAPGDYMVRPPQPAVFFFVLDVSEPAVTSGMLTSAVNAIKASLDDLPGAPRTQIGLLTFDSTLHFYNLKSTLSSAQMLVVSDISDVIMPLPEDLLVNLADSRAVFESLLDALPNMFKSSTASQAATGPALLAAKRVIQHVGGKLILCQASLPSLGEGILKMRENPRLLGSDKEHTLLQPDEAWYKTQAVDFSRLQIAIDTFLFSAQYTDVATLSSLSKHTSGSTYYYPAFYGPRDGEKFEKEMMHNLTRAIAFESVMRVRATRGVRFTAFYGNYFIRGTDLMALPNCTSDSSFALDMAYEEATLPGQVITIQAALLYTNSNSERRIRVHTMVLPVTQNVLEMVDTVDIDCAMNLLAKQAVDMALKTGFENARQRVLQTTTEIIRAARTASLTPVNMPGMPYGAPGGPPGGAPGANAALANKPLPASLTLLPLYSMSLLKSLVLRGSTDVRVDERAFFHQLLMNMDVEESRTFIYPRMFSIHDMAMDAGLPSDNADDDALVAGPLRVRLPQLVNLSYERLSSGGIVLLENGYDMFMWIGRGVNPAILSTLFGLPSLEGVDPTKLSIQPENSDFSSRVHAVIVALRAERSRHMQLHFIREGDGYAEAYFARYLVEDRANFSGAGLSYTEYYALVQR